MDALYFLMFLSIALSGLQLGKTQNVEPKNAAGRQGETLELNCTYEQRPIQWGYYELGSTSNTFIYQAGDVVNAHKDRYEKGSRQHNIIIRNMQYNTAGKYSCSSADAGDVKQRDIQIAGANKVQCIRNSNNPQEEGDTPTLSCEVDVSANSQLKPTFQWTRNGEPVDGWMMYQETTPGPGVPKPYVFNHNFTVTSDDHEVPFECHFSFKYAGSVGNPVVDGSDPEYTDSCSLSFEVLFGPKNVHIEPSSHDEPLGYLTVEVGEVLTCYANGTDPLTYQWRQDNGEIYVPTQDLEITDEMVDYGQVIMNCTVTNDINGRIYSDSDSVIFFALPRSSATVLNSYISLWMVLSSSILNFAHR